MNKGYVINRGHYLKRFVINIRASKNISGLVKVTVTSPVGLMKFLLNVEPCKLKIFHVTGPCRHDNAQLYLKEEDPLHSHVDLVGR